MHVLIQCSHFHTMTQIENKAVCVLTTFSPISATLPVSPKSTCTFIWVQRVFLSPFLYKHVFVSGSAYNLYSVDAEKTRRWCLSVHISLSWGWIASMWQVAVGQNIKAVLDEAFYSPEINKCYIWGIRLWEFNILKLYLINLVIELL